VAIILYAPMIKNLLVVVRCYLGDDEVARVCLYASHA
jgi:hypothetical protein